MKTFACVMAVVTTALAAPASIQLPAGMKVGAMEWSNCGDNSTQICPTTSATLSPDPPHPGSSMKITLNCEASKETTGGEVEAQVFLGPIKVDTEKENYCDVVTCPAPAGRRSGGMTHALPASTPKGTAITIHSEATDTSGATIFCTVIHFTVE
mmetsp:Transcript_128684/g.181497  ORF Transcript_128684/g.181497 Transcript_128684/m.181497 type:complete len:154 (-) Transcript_128684:140-601(-)